MSRYIYEGQGLQAVRKKNLLHSPVCKGDPEQTPSGPRADQEQTQIFKKQT